MLFFPENESDHQKFCGPLAQTRKGLRDLVRHEAACSNGKKGEANSKKKAREQEPAEAELGTEPGEAEPGEAEPGEADSQQVADQEPAKAAPASGSKPEKALPAMATEKAKAKAKALPAPSKAQWNDVHYTMKKLEKAGKMDLPEKRKKACLGGHQCKREFYYHTFLLS